MMSRDMGLRGTRGTARFQVVVNQGLGEPKVTAKSPRTTSTPFETSPRRTMVSSFGDEEREVTGHTNLSLSESQSF